MVFFEIDFRRGRFYWKSQPVTAFRDPSGEENVEEKGLSADHQSADQAQRTEVIGFKPTNALTASPLQAYLIRFSSSPLDGSPLAPSTFPFPLPKAEAADLLVTLPPGLGVGFDPLPLAFRFFGDLDLDVCGGGGGRGSRKAGSI